jgi:cytoskeleton-associated protein 5
MDALFSMIQVSELEVEFEKMKGEEAVPSRYLKSQQQKQAKLAVEAAAAGNAEGENVTALVISRITS